MSSPATSASTQARSPSSVGSACATSVVVTTSPPTSAPTQARSLLRVTFVGESLPGAMNARGIPKSTYDRRTKKQTKVLWPLRPPLPSLPTRPQWLHLTHPPPPPPSRPLCPPPTPLLVPLPTHLPHTVASPPPQWPPPMPRFHLLSLPRSAASLLQRSPTPSAPRLGFRT
ncbi:hypothetical protein LEMLEM_LOCUS7369 [Lemmus lemmus]